MDAYEATEKAYKNGYEAGKKDVTKINKSAYWAWAIKNSICIICWIVLAIIFNKWWIALFAALFLSDLRFN